MSKAAEEFASYHACNKIKILPVGHGVLLGGVCNSVVYIGLCGRFKLRAYTIFNESDPNGGTYRDSRYSEPCSTRRMFSVVINRVLNQVSALYICASIQEILQLD